jgi:hypothetical protein
MVCLPLVKFWEFIKELQVLLWNNSLDKALGIQYIALDWLYAPPIFQTTAVKICIQKNRVFWGTLCEFLELILDPAYKSIYCIWPLTTTGISHQRYMATYFLEFSDQNYGEICYSIRKVPMGQSKFTAQSFQKTATFGRYASAFMVKMDHQMVHK